MATTAAGTPYVESADLVANYPGVSLALANHIDTIGKVRQVIRSTDTTERSTTSTSLTDTGMSVTITPTKTNSNIILIASMYANIFSSASVSDLRGTLVITDNSNNLISGAQNNNYGGFNINQGSGLATLESIAVLIGYNSPNTLSATTYKIRFKTFTASATARLSNNTNTGQILAIEVAA